MTTTFTDITLECKFSTGVWTDIGDDLISAINVKTGITGSGPLDRVASTGVMKFTLLNTDNKYTPMHNDCTSGFEKGTHCRLTVTYDGTERTKFYGRIDEIYIRGGFGIPYYTEVTVLDYMNILATHELQLPAIYTDSSMSQVVMYIIDNMNIQPLSTEVYTSQDTFATIFDTMKPKTIALQELAKAVNSELGYLYLRYKAYGGSTSIYSVYVSGAGNTTVNGTYYYIGDYNSKPEYREKEGNSIRWAGSAWIIETTNTIYYTSSDDVATPDLCTTWEVGPQGSAPVPAVVEAATVYDNEVLVSAGRYYRPQLTSQATFTDAQIANANIEYGEQYYNEVKTITYPRKVDSAATSVLFTLNRYVAIDPSATVTVTGRFIDPDQEAVSVTGTDMVTPVATTDYLFNTASDGSGSDITADLDVTATYGANGVEYELTNNNASMGYVTFLQARGKGIYTYNPVEYSSEYDTGIDADGRVTLTLSMPYQDNPLIGEDFASSLLDIYKSKKLLITTISYEPNKSEALIECFRDLYTGDRITLQLTDLNIESDYFINGMNFSVAPTGAVACEYTVVSEALMPAANFWILSDNVSYVDESELGVTTKLGF